VETIMTPLFRGLKRTSLALLTAGSLLAIGAGGAAAQTPFGAQDRTSEARVTFSGAERGTPILAGGAVTVAGQGFRPGQQVTLLYGATPLPGGSLTADGEGKIAGRLTVPANAVSGTHPIVVVATAPYAAIVAELKVSPTVPLSGQQTYEVKEAGVARGLYQSAYSRKNNTLFVTAATGRPPVTDSTLLKLNADSMAVLARVTPPPAPAPQRAPAAAQPAGGPQGQPVFAVYGVGVDDAKDTVWVTNTRKNTVAVYRQADLSLIKQFDPEAVAHARDIAVDSGVGKAYASAATTPNIVVIDTAGLTVAKSIPIRSLRRGAAFSALSLSLDAAAHKLYVVSMSTNEVAIINTQTDEVEKVLPVPGAKGSIGISHDPRSGRIYVAAQESDNLVVLDKDGKVIADTPVGAGALNVVFDPVAQRAYVSNRGAGTIAVTDADGKLVANLGPAPLANHVSLGKDGVVYAVDKSAGARDAENDTILRIRPRR